MCDISGCGDDGGGLTGDSGDDVRSAPRKPKRPEKNMKRLTWNEIPLPVLKSIFRKWYRILGKGVWRDVIWRYCDLCPYVKKVAVKRGCSEFDKCCFCPAVKGVWCHNTKMESRLAIDYHVDTGAWLRAVALFVAMMRNLINCREGKQ